MQYYCPQTTCKITLSPARKIGRGGEGTIYVVDGMPGLVAKLFHRPTLEQQRKLEIMLFNSCKAESAARPVIAWPIGLLFDNRNRALFCGYIMPRITGACPAIELYNPKSRRNKCPGFNYRYLHRAALNISQCCRLAHERGYVIGDLNESTFLIHDNGCVTMVDAESMQMLDAKNRRILRCRVGKPEFTPAELQGKNLAAVVRTVDHDHFALGVLLFRLLMEGVHPFDGIFRGVAMEVPSLESRIAAGHFPYGTRVVPWAPKPLAAKFTILHPELQQLFLHCFETGYFNPKARPDTKTWVNTLRRAEQDLVKCPSNQQHWHGRHLNRCPWCDRANVLGFDPFPDPSIAFSKLKHILPAGRRRMSPRVTINPTLLSTRKGPKQMIQAAQHQRKSCAPVGMGLWVVTAVIFLFALICAIYGGTNSRSIITP